MLIIKPYERNKRGSLNMWVSPIWPLYPAVHTPASLSLIGTTGPWGCLTQRGALEVGDSRDQPSHSVKCEGFCWITHFLFMINFPLFLLDTTFFILHWLSSFLHCMSLCVSLGASNGLHISGASFCSRFWFLGHVQHFKGVTPALCSLLGSVQEACLVPGFEPGPWSQSYAKQVP